MFSVNFKLRHVFLQLVPFHLEFKISSLSPLIPLRIFICHHSLYKSQVHGHFLEKSKWLLLDNISRIRLAWVCEAKCKHSLSQETILDRLCFDFASLIIHHESLLLFNKKYIGLQPPTRFCPSIEVKRLIRNDLLPSKTKCPNKIRYTER